MEAFDVTRIYANNRNGGLENTPIQVYRGVLTVGGPTTIIAADTTKKTRVLGGIFQGYTSTPGELALYAGSNIKTDFFPPANTLAPLVIPVTPYGYMFETAVNETVRYAVVTATVLVTIYYNQYTP